MDISKDHRKLQAREYFTLILGGITILRRPNILQSNNRMVRCSDDPIDDEWISVIVAIILLPVDHFR